MLVCVVCLLLVRVCCGYSLMWVVVVVCHCVVLVVRVCFVGLV